jgi:hypothetical protein
MASERLPLPTKLAAGVGFGQAYISGEPPLGRLGAARAGVGMLRLILGYLQDRRLRRTRPAPIVPGVWAWLGTQRLSLRGLSRPVQAMAGCCMATAGLAGGLLVAQGAGLSLPGGRDPVPLYESLPALVPPTAYAGLAVIAATAALAARQERWRWPRLTLWLVGLIGATLAAYMVAIGLLTMTTAGAAALLRTASASIFVGLAAGLLGLAAAVVLVAAATRLLRGSPVVLCLVAAAPFGLALLTWMLADAHRVAVPEEAFARLAPTSVMSARGLFAVPAIQLSAALGLSIGLLLLWQVVGGSRAARDAGLLASALGGGLARLLVVMLAAKLVWLGFGYAGLLPAVLGGRADVWTASRQDGWLSWALAIGLVGTGAWWLATRDRRQPLSEAGFNTAVWVVVAGFQLFPLLASLLILSEPWEMLVSLQKPIEWVAELRNWLGNVLGVLFFVSVPLTVVGAALAAFVLLRRQRTERNLARLSAAIFLAAFAAWNLPRIVIGSGQLLGVWPQTDPQTDPLPGAVEPATVDVLLTIAIAMLLMLWWQGRQGGAGPAALTLVLIVSTLVAHVTTLLPPEWGQGALFFIGLVLPLAYALLFDAAALNEEALGRPARVLAAVGITAVLLVLASVQVAVGFLGPDRATEAELGARLLLIPFVAILVATTVDDLSERQPFSRTPARSLRTD